MARLRIWALVTNGVRARILRGVERDTHEPPLEILSKSSSPHLRDILSDRPGRSFSSDGSGRRAAMEPGSDPIRHDMEVFARETLAALESHHRAGAFDRRAVFASPPMLGILRQEMSATLRAKVILERATNLVGRSEDDLRAAVRRAIRTTSNER